jgi:hypothetical protein
MPSRAVLERQLKLAEQSLSKRVKALESAGKSGDACALDPMWRNANAECSKLRRRLTAVAALEANNAEVVRRKSEPKPEPEVAEKPKKAAKAAAKEAAPKEGKPKTKGDEKSKAKAEDKPKKAKAEK